MAIKNTSDSWYYSSKPGTFTLNDAEERTYMWVDDRDLNRNAGGDDIFLGWSYDLVD